MGDRRTRFLGRFHIGDEQGLRALIEDALDEHHVIPGWADQRRDARALDRAEMVDHIRNSTANARYR